MQAGTGGIVMGEKVSKKQQACVSRYVAAHYDRLAITVPQGMKEVIAEAAKQLPSGTGSVNGFVNEAIREKLERMGIEYQK